MLQSIRDGIQGWISALIIGIICIPFAFWGVTSYFTGGGEVVVANVADGEINQRDFQQAYQARYQAEQRRLGGSAELIDEQSLKLQVLEGMVSRESLSQHLSDAGYDIADDKLIEALHGNPYLQQDGAFSQSRYGQLLAALGMDPATYEESLRRSLRVDQLQAGLSESVAIGDAEVKRLWALQNQTRDISSAEIKVDALTASINVSEDDIQEWYEDHLEQYVSEERVRVSYIELSMADLETRVSVDDSDIEERYEEDKERYTAPEQRRASHILIAGDVSDENKQKLEDLKARIAAGEAFGDLAKENSDDPGSAAENGDLGMVGRGVMVKAFEDALFELDNVGDLSDVVETQFGLHLIQLNEIQAEASRDLSEVRAEIEMALRVEKAESEFDESVEQLSEITYENPDDLVEAADVLELTVRTSGWFTRDRGTGVSSDAAVRNAAFSSEVLQDDENSEVIELGDDRVMVVRKTDYEPSEQKALSEVSEDIDRTIRLQRAQVKATQLADRVLEAVNGGATLQAAAKVSGLEVVQHGAVKRDSSALNSMALQEAFALPRPADKASLGKTRLFNGDVLVFSVEKVSTPNLDSETASAEQDALREQLETQRGRTELFAALRDIREKTAVKLHLNRL